MSFNLWEVASGGYLLLGGYLLCKWILEYNLLHLMTNNYNQFNIVRFLCFLLYLNLDYLQEYVLHSKYLLIQNYSRVSKVKLHNTVGNTVSINFRPTMWTSQPYIFFSSLEKGLKVQNIKNSWKVLCAVYLDSFSGKLVDYRALKKNLVFGNFQQKLTCLREVLRTRITLPTSTRSYCREGPSAKSIGNTVTRRSR